MCNLSNTKIRARFSIGKKCVFTNFSREISFSEALCLRKLVIMLWFHNFFKCIYHGIRKKLKKILNCCLILFIYLFIIIIWYRRLLVIHFIHICIYMSIPTSQFITPPQPPSAAFSPWCPYICSLHLCLNFCPANQFICTIILGSTYMR